MDGCSKPSSRLNPDIEELRANLNKMEPEVWSGAYRPNVGDVVSIAPPNYPASLATVCEVIPNRVLVHWHSRRDGDIHRVYGPDLVYVRSATAVERKSARLAKIPTLPGRNGAPA